MNRQAEVPPQLLESVPLGWAWLKSNKRLHRPHYLYLISDALAKVAAGRIKMLFIFAPPRHYKSEMCTVWFPAWLLNRDPDKYIVCVSHGSDLATDFGRKARDLVTEHGKFKLRADVAAASKWEIEGKDPVDGHKYRGGMYSVGWGGSILGRGADVMIIDDPVKNFEDVISLPARDKAWEYFRSTYFNRLEPGAALILVMQRWHEDDIAGRLMKQFPDATVLRFPALAEADDACGRQIGEPLNPDRYDREALERIRIASGWWWYAQYQQRPIPPEGQTVSAEWFPLWKEPLPRFLSAIRYFDMAVKRVGGQKRGDYAAGPLVVRDTELRTGVLDMYRARKTTAEIENFLADACASDWRFLQSFKYFEGDKEHNLYDETWWITNYKLWFESDTGGMGEYAASSMQRRLAALLEARGVPVPSIYFEHPTGNKVVRADPVMAQAKAGNVWLWGVQSSAEQHLFGRWDIEGFLGRAVLFPNGEYDDEIDGLSGAYSKLPATVYKEGEKLVYWI